ncbi:MAG: hypothetical protein ACRDHG_02935 [Anaerolineales bacterium]
MFSETWIRGAVGVEVEAGVGVLDGVLVGGWGVALGGGRVGAESSRARTVAATAVAIWSWPAGRLQAAARTSSKLPAIAVRVF